MKIKTAKLEWYAFYIHNNKLVQENILKDDLKERIVKAYHKKELTSLDYLYGLISRDFIYHYWSKSEFEVGVVSLFEKNIENAEKIDVYYQLKPNIKRIAEYINAEMQLNLKWEK